MRLLTIGMTVAEADTGQCFGGFIRGIPLGLPTLATDQSPIIESCGEGRVRSRDLGLNGTQNRVEDRRSVGHMGNGDPATGDQPLAL
jgi:hypothetical protein